MFEKKELEKQGEFWIETRRLPKLSAGGFYQRVNEVLGAIGFAEEVHRLCRLVEMLLEELRRHRILIPTRTCQ